MITGVAWRRGRSGRRPPGLGRRLVEHAAQRKEELGRLAPEPGIPRWRRPRSGAAAASAAPICVCMGWRRKPLPKPAPARPGRPHAAHARAKSARGNLEPTASPRQSVASACRAAHPARPEPIEVIRAPGAAQKGSQRTGCSEERQVEREARREALRARASCGCPRARARGFGVRRVGRHEAEAPVEADGRVARRRRDVQAPGAVGARETRDLGGQQRGDALAAMAAAHVEGRQVAYVSARRGR